MGFSSGFANLSCTVFPFPDVMWHSLRSILFSMSSGSCSASGCLHIMLSLIFNSFSATSYTGFVFVPFLYTSYSVHVSYSNGITGFF